MVKNIRRDLVQRMKNRMLAESIIESFVSQLIKSNDRGGADEFINSEDFYLILDGKEVYLL